MSWLRRRYASIFLWWISPRWVQKFQGRLLKQPMALDTLLNLSLQSFLNCSARRLQCWPAGNIWTLFETAEPNAAPTSYSFDVSIVSWLAQLWGNSCSTILLHSQNLFLCSFSLSGGMWPNLKWTRRNEQWAMSWPNCSWQIEPASQSWALAFYFCFKSHR